MKAAVIHTIGTTLQYEDFSVPVAQNEYQLVMQVTGSVTKKPGQVTCVGCTL